MLSKVRYHVWIYAGVLLLLLGLQLRAVDAFVLSTRTTQMAAEWFGPSGQPNGLARLAISSDAGGRRHVQPPVWLGWAMLSCGVVLLAHGLIQRRAKR
jgi:hypothetical protein